MKVDREQLEPTKLKLTVVADPGELEEVRQAVLAKLGASVKVSGFREGKAPTNLIEKQLDPSVYQSEFLDQAVNQLYAMAAKDVKVVAPPQIAITKFVPFTSLEFSAEVEAVGDITLADYKNIKLAAKTVSVSADEVNKVVDNLLKQAATKSEVKRAAKDGDEVTIDFKGSDSKTKEPIEGADGKDYPLILGSKNFIPGFEEALVGLKTGDSKTFELTFPKDYGAAELQNRKVTFEVAVTKVSELKVPKLDDAFVSTLGPFKAVSELKADIKKQLLAEKNAEARQAYENELLTKIAEKTEAAIPKVLVDEEIERMEEDEKRNLVYRGQTWQDHLTSEGVSEEEHAEKKRPAAEERIKAGLALGEISEKEKITVTPEELEMRLELLKGQYTDQAMQAELDKPENRRDILARLMTEKTLDRLRELATK